MHYSEVCYQVLYFVHASLLFASRITPYILSLLYQSQIGEEKTEFRVVLFCAVALSNFVGNWSKQVSKIRLVDGPWDSGLSLSLMIETSCVWGFFFFYSFWKSDL